MPKSISLPSAATVYPMDVGGVRLPAREKGADFVSVYRKENTMTAATVSGGTPGGPEAELCPLSRFNARRNWRALQGGMRGVCRRSAAGLGDFGRGSLTLALST
ncbi:MAG: hypothetical protein ACLR23_28470 [Clostridia bacterium]